MFVAAILAPALAWAQDGAIVGRVLDAAGDPLPGTTIEVVGAALAEPRVSVTDLQGRYRVTELPLGMYTVTLSLPGFRSLVRDGVVVVTGLAPRVDAELDVGTDDDVRVDIRIYLPGDPAHPGHGDRRPKGGKAIRAGVHRGASPAPNQRGTTPKSSISSRQDPAAAPASRSDQARCRTRLMTASPS